MSYILDALNKSEQERKLSDHGVSLQPLTGVPHADKSSPRWVPIAAVAFVLAAVGIFVGVYFAMKSPTQAAVSASSVPSAPSAVPLPQASRPAAAPAVTPPAPQVTAAQPAVVAAAPAAETPAARSAPPAVARTAASDSVKSLYQRKGMPAEQAMAQSVQTFASDQAATVRTQDVVSQEPPVAKSTINQKALDAEVARQVAQHREAELAARVQAELEKMQAQDAAVAAQRAQSQPKPEPRKESARAAPVADPDANVPLATQLANDVQKRIPNIEFGAHVYAGNTNAGFVILNGKKRYSGDSVVPGLVVERITESGVILDLNGTRFRLNSMSSWIN